MVRFQRMTFQKWIKLTMGQNSKTQAVNEGSAAYEQLMYELGGFSIGQKRSNQAMETFLTVLNNYCELIDTVASSPIPSAAITCSQPCTIFRSLLCKAEMRYVSSSEGLSLRGSLA